MPKLKIEILKKLIKKTELEESTIRSALSRIREKYAFLTLNASAQIFAKEHGFTVTNQLDPVDRQALSHLEEKRVVVPIKQKKEKKETIIKMANYETNDSLLQKHIDEINRTYTFHCYTATFILCRKVLENLILNILKNKYSENKLEHRTKYIDVKRGRVADFSVLLSNLGESSKDFGPPYDKLANRICQLSEAFKDDANDMTHSLYHIASKREIDENKFQEILDLIRKLEVSQKES
jgi:hypothetical protein